MDKIKTAIRVAELSATTQQLVKIYEATGKQLSDKFLGKIFGQISSLASTLNQSIKMSKTASDLEESDSVRDGKVSALNSMLKGYASFPVAEISLAANNLLKIFSKYGTDINKKGYLEESGLITSLLTDLKTQTAKAEIAKLASVQVAIDELEAAQTAFDTAYLAFEAAKVNDGNLVSASEVKKPLLVEINEKLVPYLTALESEAEYENFCKMVGQLIDDLNSKVASHSKKKKEE